MKRCLLTLFLKLSAPVVCGLVAAAGLLTLNPALAQNDPNAAPTKTRVFPPKALRGTLLVTAPPQIMLNQKASQLAPGALIYDTKNLKVLSGSLLNQSLLVNYTLDALGQVQQVWLLTPQEAQEKRPTNQAPATDVATPDALTPYEQLPLYK